ncbi:DUF932 domain-containing protein [Pantoea ananatis]
MVCNNTLSIALGNASAAVKVPHRSRFVARMKALVERPVDLLRA